MTRVHVIRHGRPASSWGDAEQDPGLDAEGRLQAATVAKALMDLPAEERPVRVVLSPLHRCRETAQPLAAAPGVDLVIDPDVGEIPTPAKVDPTDRPAWLREAFEGDWGQIAGDLDYRAWAQSVASAVARHGGAAVFSHFVALNAVVSVATGDEKVAVFRPDHCSATIFEVCDGRLILVAKGREAQSQVL